MKHLLLLSLLAALGLSAGCAATRPVKAYAGDDLLPAQVATILVPATVELRSINGQSYPQPTLVFHPTDQTLAVRPGAQVWELRYFNSRLDTFYFDPGEVTESPWTVIRFTAEAGASYRLNVETPREDPQLSKTAERVRFSVAEVGRRSAAGPVPRPAVPSGNPPVAARAAPPAPVPTAPAAAAEAPQSLESAALGQLKKWWGVAGPEEQHAFREWLKAQP